MRAYINQLYVIFFLSIYHLGFAQSFIQEKKFCDTCSHHFRGKFESVSFIKNNEYFNDFSKGYTGIGYLVKPGFEYYISEKTKVHAGIFLLQFSGLDKFSQVMPDFSVCHQFNPSLSLAMGSLHANLNHGLVEPMYRFDGFYQNNLEYGAQLLLKNNWIKSDLWVSWEQFIMKDDPFQEEIWAGWVNNFGVLDDEKISLEIPLQMTIFHKGGQIDKSPDPAFSIVNGMIGINIIRPMPKGSQLIASPQWYIYQGLGLPDSGVNSQFFDQGTGKFFNLAYESKVFDFSVGYWLADGYISPKGEQLFQSVSDFKVDFFQRNRKLIKSGLALKHSFTDAVLMEVRGDGYYDIDHADFAYSYAFYLILRDSFFLASKKQ